MMHVFRTLKWQLFNRTKDVMRKVYTINQRQKKYVVLRSMSFQRHLECVTIAILLQNYFVYGNFKRIKRIDL